MLAFDYNAIDSVPLSKIAMMGYKGAVKTVPWLDAACILDVTQMPTDLWVRNGVPPTSSDLKTYDPAILFVATTNNADTSNLGDLWVEYDVSLKDPSEVIGAGFKFAAAGTVNVSNPFGTYGSQTGQVGTLAGTWSGTTFTFGTSGVWVIAGYLAGTATGIGITGTVTVGGNQTVASGGNIDTIITVTALQGQTMILGYTGGTVTGASWYFGSTVPGAV
jgi:hypothetical protein